MSSLRIISSPITHEELHTLAQEGYGDMVKGVVDIEKGIMVVGGEMHADEERLLRDQGSRQDDLWGINLYPGETKERFLEFDSMINIRPSRGNRSRSVEDAGMRARIQALVASLIH